MESVRISRGCVGGYNTTTRTTEAERGAALGWLEDCCVCVAMRMLMRTEGEREREREMEVKMVLFGVEGGFYAARGKYGILGRFTVFSVRMMGCIYGICTIWGLIIAETCGIRNRVYIVP